MNSAAYGIILCRSLRFVYKVQDRLHAHGQMGRFMTDFSLKNKNAVELSCESGLCEFCKDIYVCCRLTTINFGGIVLSVKVKIKEPEKNFNYRSHCPFSVSSR